MFFRDSNVFLLIFQSQYTFDSKITSMSTHLFLASRKDLRILFSVKIYVSIYILVCALPIFSIILSITVLSGVVST